MDILWRRVKPLKSNDLIDSFEKKYGYIVPEELKEVIIANNGGRPSPKILTNKVGQDFEIKSLLSYNNDDVENIYRIIDFFVENYNRELLPFAMDSAGNYYCINNKRVILWTQDDEIITVCDSFNEFIKLLGANNA